MIANISYKLSAFADYTDISYTSENVLKIITALKEMDLLPGVVQEILVDGNASRRIQLTSVNGDLVVTIFSSRIDAEITSLNKSGFADKERKELIPQLCGIIRTLFEVFGETIPIANRLAWFVSYVNFEIDAEEKKSFREAFLKPISFYESNATDEFMVRYSGREQVQLDNFEETLNILTTITRFLANQGTNVEIDGYKIDFDINTWQKNRKNRFDGNTVISFVEKATEFQEKLEADFINVYK